MKTWRPFLVLGMCATLGAGTTALLVPRPEGVNILPEAALRLPMPLWIDARGEGDFSRGHVPGALLLNEDNWSQAIVGVLEAWSPGRPIVVYCGSSKCSASHAVARRLRGEEYQLEPVHVLRGGWDALEMSARIGKELKWP
ncbi:MAG: rhodanese-like domain-containing protein [Puniceicoccales bacterium]|jgi:rhodanese-related sulfurtransferase|nr:rhodanese-like domain-containing protein [Puniceicoccales bacterium]